VHWDFNISGASNYALLSRDPWFCAWNYQLLRVLFQAIPHRTSIDRLFEFLIFDHLVSTWVFAAVFYSFWQIDDERREWRRCRLFQIVVAFAVAVLISLLLRPWIHWPAPVLNPHFQQLFPDYFWGKGSRDSFPSHATLLYFTVALGIWPLKRSLSAILCVLTLVLISFSRVYVGGHYPIDVLSSLVLAFVILVAVWRWRIPTVVASWLAEPARNLGVRELLLVGWIFELGEEFGGITSLLLRVRQCLPKL
jgi:membrane-associated phospholipid phosphatase